MPEVLRVSNLRKSFRKTGFSRQKIEVLKGLSFSVSEGRITGFLGANGAGKTTTLKCLLGLAFPDQGKVEYFGEEGLTEAIKARIGFLPERPYFYEYLTGVEFLRFYGQVSRKFLKQELDDKIKSLLHRVGLGHAATKPLRAYSKGMLQRIGIAQALIHDPEFVILDEPMTGLDPDGRWEVTQIIKETAQMGTSVFFSSHLLHDAEKLCERVVVLKEGEVLFHGATQDFVGHVEPKFSLSYRDPRAASDHLFESEVSTAAELQKAIDGVRSQNMEIVEVRKVQVGLEEAFIKAAFGKMR